MISCLIIFGIDSDNSFQKQLLRKHCRHGGLGGEEKSTAGTSPLPAKYGSLGEKSLPCWAGRGGKEPPLPESVVCSRDGKTAEHEKTRDFRRNFP